MSRIPKHLEAYKEIFSTYMLTHSRDIQKEYSKIYDEAIEVYVNLLLKSLKENPVDGSMGPKFEHMLNDIKTSHTIPGYLMTEEFYVVKDMIMFRYLNRQYDLIYAYCVEKLETEFYIYDEAVAKNFTDSFLDFITDTIWIDSVPSQYELELRKN